MNKLLEKKVDVIADAVAELKKSNVSIAKFVAEAQKNGLSVEETIEKSTSIFKETIKNAKNVDDLHGKAFFVSNKDAKLGSVSYEEDGGSSIGNDMFNNYDVLSGYFSSTPTSKDTIAHTFHQGRNEITIDGTPIAECAPADNGNYSFGKANFAINKYALKCPTSIEFIEFVDGGWENLLSVLITDLYNLFTKFSLHADSQANNHYGLFNETTDRNFAVQTLETAGTITVDDLIDLQGTSKISVINGSYIMPNSMYLKISKLKDNDGNLIFNRTNGGPQTFGAYTFTGTIASKPVYVVSDDVWFKYVDDSFEDISTEDVELIFYGSPEAFQYYKGSTAKYETLFEEVFAQGGVAIQLDKDATNVGCLNVTAFMFAGFGVTNPTVGTILKNPTILIP